MSNVRLLLNDLLQCPNFDANTCTNQYTITYRDPHTNAYSDQHAITNLDPHANTHINAYPNDRNSNFVACRSCMHRQYTANLAVDERRELLQLPTFTFMGRDSA